MLSYLFMDLSLEVSYVLHSFSTSHQLKNYVRHSPSKSLHSQFQLYSFAFSNTLSSLYLNWEYLSVTDSSSFCFPYEKQMIVWNNFSRAHLHHSVHMVNLESYLIVFSLNNCTLLKHHYLVQVVCFLHFW